MSEITIKLVEFDESLAYSRLIRGYAFGKTPPLPDIEEYEKTAEYFKNLTNIVVFEDDQPLAMVASQPMTENVRGKVMQMAGILGVASHPMARRRGFVRQAMNELLRVEREKGMPVSGLYPFRESFYHRMGYVQFPQFWDYHIKPQEMLPAMARRPDGEVTHHSIKDAYPEYAAYMERTQQLRHGFSLFDEARAVQLRDNDSLWVVFARYEGEVIGMMLYNIEGFWKKLTVTHFFYHDPRARYLLLDFLALHTDQVEEFQLRLPPWENPANWMPDVKLTADRPRLIAMGRVLDVEKLAGINSGEGQFTATITDENCPWNSGHWHFEGRNGELLVSKADSGEVDLSIQAISALIYGTHDPAEYAYHGWGTPTPEMIETMRQMFPLASAYMHEQY